MKHYSYNCDKCLDSGWITKYRDDGSRYVVSCQCRNKKIQSYQWKKSGISLCNSNYTLKNYEVWNDDSKFAKDSTIAFHNDFKNTKSKRQNSIIFCGQVGSGKTHLAVALALNFIRENISVVYMPYRDAITEIKQSILEKENYQKLIDKYKTCEVLLIDDLYKGKINTSDINIMFEIVNYRYLNYMPMIINSEFTVDDILKFDESIGSRIIEMCKGYLIEFAKNQSNNYRLKN